MDSFEKPRLSHGAPNQVPWPPHMSKLSPTAFDIWVGPGQLEGSPPTHWHIRSTMAHHHSPTLPTAAADEELMENVSPPTILLSIESPSKLEPTWMVLGSTSPRLIRASTCMVQWACRGWGGCARLEMGETVKLTTSTQRDLTSQRLRRASESAPMKICAH